MKESEKDNVHEKDCMLNQKSIDNKENIENSMESKEENPQDALEKNSESTHLEDQENKTTEESFEILETITIDDLMESGAQFGHKKNQNHPKMKDYICIHSQDNNAIIDLDKTLVLLEKACKFLENSCAKGSKVLFVCTKKKNQINELVSNLAIKYGIASICNKFLPGSLTNFKTISGVLNRINEDEKLITKNPRFFTKKEISSLRRKINKRLSVLSGMTLLKSNLPDVIFVIDAKKEEYVIKEARKLSIPVVAIVDSDGDPTSVDYPIICSDDSYKCVSLLLGKIIYHITLGMKKAAKDDNKGSFKQRVTDEMRNKKANNYNFKNTRNNNLTSKNDNIPTEKKFQ